MVPTTILVPAGVDGDANGKLDVTLYYVLYTVMVVTVAHVMMLRLAGVEGQ